MNKKILRSKMLEKRNNLSEEEIINFSNQVISRLEESEEFKHSENIFAFVSFGSEVFTHDFIKNSINNGKNIYIPHIDKEKNLMIASKLETFDDLELGYYNILSLPHNKVKEVNPSILDLIIVPGLIFGKNFYRIGYGGGYYDKYLSQSNLNTCNIGICFDIQITDKVESNIYDVPVDKIITNSTVLERKLK